MSRSSGQRPVSSFAPLRAMLACAESSHKKIRFVRYGNLVLINESSLPKLGIDYTTPTLSQDDEILKQLKKQFLCSRVAIKGRIKDDDFRSPSVRVLTGKGEEEVDPWVEQVDNGIRYCFNIEKSMFCKGNIKEKLRLSKMDCSEEIVVDLFAGIGYFAIIFAVHCNAKRVYCCEWNPVSIEALRRNAVLNKVDEKIVVCEGDNRLVCPVGVASRVNMGLIPTSLASLETACKALDVNTFPKLFLHVHENLTYQWDQDDVHSKKEQVQQARKRWADGIAEQVQATMSRLYPELRFQVQATEVVCIKHYAPHIDHMVVDICCTK